MPFRRSYRKPSYSRKRKTYKRSTYRRKGGLMNTPMTLGGVWRGLKYVKSLINVEKKYTDIELGTTVARAPQAICISALAQGDTYNTRDGDSCKTLDFVLNFEMLKTSLSGVENVRMVIFKDTIGNGETPVWTDLFSDDLIMSNYKRRGDDVGRYQIFKDQMFFFSGSGDTNSYAKQIKFNIPTQTHLKFKGATSASSDTGKNAVWLLIRSRYNDAAVEWFGSSRMIFVDN